MQTKMRSAVLALIAIGSVATPVAAKSHRHYAQPVRYENNGRYYNSYEACRASKHNAGRDGAIVGAATAGVGAALLGANFGQSALIAGGGALVGNQIGRSKHC